MFDWVLNMYLIMHALLIALENVAVTTKNERDILLPKNFKFKKTCKDVHQSDQANFKTLGKTLLKKNIWAKSTEQCKQWNLNSDIKFIKCTTIFHEL